MSAGTAAIAGGASLALLLALDDDHPNDTLAGQWPPNFSLVELDRFGDAPPWAQKNLLQLAETVLQPIRDKAGVPVAVTPRGGWNGDALDEWRLEHGQALRKSTSQHRKGLAGDLAKPSDFTYSEWVDLILKMASKGEIPSNVGIGVYDEANGFVHVDLGGRRGKFTRFGVQHF